MKTVFRTLDRRGLMPLDPLQRPRPKAWKLFDHPEDPQVILGVLECVEQQGGKFVFHCGHTFGVTILQARRDFTDNQAQVLAHIGKDEAKVEQYAIAAGRAYAQWIMEFAVHYGWIAYGLLPVAFLRDDAACGIFAKSCLERIHTAFAMDPPVYAVLGNEVESDGEEVAFGFRDFLGLWRKWEQGRLDEVPWQLIPCFEQVDSTQSRGLGAWLRRLLPGQGRKRTKQPLPLERLIQRSASDWRLIETTSLSHLWYDIECARESGGISVSYRHQLIDVNGSLEGRERFKECLWTLENMRKNPQEVEPAAINLGSAYAEMIIAFGVNEGHIWPDLRMLEEQDVLDDEWLFEGFMRGFCQCIRDRLGHGETVIQRFGNILEQRRFWHEGRSDRCMEASAWH